MTREERARDIKIICDKFGCNAAARQRHFDMFVNRQWQPHASKRFQNWWYQQKEYKDSCDENGHNGIGAVGAQNAARIWDAYLECKGNGTA
jgi:hypothetical protein